MDSPDWCGQIMIKSSIDFSFGSAKKTEVLDSFHVNWTPRISDLSVGFLNHVHQGVVSSPIILTDVQLYV